jgi:hypothetical protein
VTELGGWQHFFCEEPKHAPRLISFPALREPSDEGVEAGDGPLRHFVEHHARDPEAEGLVSA